MPLLHLLVLAVVQGLTEFLPVSSSGHLVMTWAGFDALGLGEVERDQNARLILDIAVHVGTLTAVCFYFWRDLLAMLAGVGRLATGRRSDGGRIALAVIVGTLPVIAVGFLAKDWVTASLRDLTVIAWATLGFGVLLWLSDRLGLTVRRVEHITVVQGLIIGIAQVLALIPGTSRSGITMTAARFLGFERHEAARFSLLLSIPTILGAGSLAGWDLYQAQNIALGLDALVAAGFAFVSALIAITLMMAWLRRAGFAPFVVYRVALGLLLLWLVYGEAPVALPF